MSASRCRVFVSSVYLAALFLLQSCWVFLCLLCFLLSLCCDLTHQHSTSDAHVDHSPVPLVHLATLSWHKEIVVSRGGGAFFSDPRMAVTLDELVQASSCSTNNGSNTSNNSSSHRVHHKGSSQPVNDHS